MKQKIIKRASYWLGVVVVGIALGLVLQFARAWTEPGEAPPGGNLAAPLNTSGNTQVKMGPLGVNSNGLGILPLQLGLDVGGKAQADDFCLRSDPTKCLSNISGANLSGLRVGPPGCNSALTFSSTCNTDMCDLYNSMGFCAGFCGTVSLGSGAVYRTCGGSCSAGSSKTCSTAPLGTGASFLYDSIHSTDDCTAAGGTVQQDGTDKFCKFDRTSCSSGWTQFKNWTTTTAKTCTGATNDNTKCPVSSCTTGGHDFSNTAPESCNYKSNRSWTPESCCSNWTYTCTSWVPYCWEAGCYGADCFAAGCSEWCAGYGWVCDSWYDCPYCSDSSTTCYAKTEDGIGCY